MPLVGELDVALRVGGVPVLGFRIGKFDWDLGQAVLVFGPLCVRKLLHQPPRATADVLSEAAMKAFGWRVRTGDLECCVREELDGALIGERSPRGPYSPQLATLVVHSETFAEWTAGRIHYLTALRPWMHTAPASPVVLATRLKGMGQPVRPIVRTPPPLPPVRARFRPIPSRSAGGQ